jgi:hypothetical protein
MVRMSAYATPCKFRGAETENCQGSARGTDSRHLDNRPRRVRPLCPARKDLGFDIEAERDGHPLLVEIKSQTPQTSARLNDMTSQLRTAADRYVNAVGRGMRPDLLAVIPGVLARSKRATSLPGDVEIWDGRDLQRRAREHGVRVPSFVAAPDGEENAEDRELAEELPRRLAQITLGDATLPPTRNGAKTSSTSCFARHSTHR